MLLFEFVTFSMYARRQKFTPNFDTTAIRLRKRLSAADTLFLSLRLSWPVFHSHINQMELPYRTILWVSFLVLIFKSLPIERFNYYYYFFFPIIHYYYYFLIIIEWSWTNSIIIVFFITTFHFTSQFPAKYITLVFLESAFSYFIFSSPTGVVVRILTS